VSEVEIPSGTLSPKATLIYDALIFAFWAAGEGIEPAEGEKVGDQGVNAPDVFFWEYSDQSGDEEDWDTAADRISKEFDTLAAQASRDAAEIARQREVIAGLRADKDGAYDERNRLVALLAGLFPSGTARPEIPGWDPEWLGCVYIDFPWGQASWHFHDSQAHLFAHLPPYPGEWDGHTTEAKYEAIARAALSRAQAGDSEGRADG